MALANMAGPVKPEKRPYHAPQRAASAARTREAIVTAAKDAFERLGWPGATMRGIADQAGVSVKSAEALYRTKTELLKQVIDYAIAGYLRPIPILARESVAAIEAAPDPPTMLDLHARHHARGIAERAAPTLRVVEQAAPTHEEIARLWAQSSDNRPSGARWAATTLLSKPDVPRHITQRYAEEVFWTAIDPATYRSLTIGRCLSPPGYESWIRDFYGKMLLR